MKTTSPQALTLDFLIDTSGKSSLATGYDILNRKIKESFLDEEWVMVSMLLIFFVIKWVDKYAQMVV